MLEPNGNKFVDYINWIVRRLSSIPFVRLPDPRPNEPIITLTLIRWSQNPMAPPPPRPIISSRKRPGRPPTKRPTDPVNGTPVVVVGGNTPSSSNASSPTPNGTEKDVNSVRPSSSVISTRRYTDVTATGRPSSPPRDSYGSLTDADLATLIGLRLDGSPPFSGREWSFHSLPQEPQAEHLTYLPKRPGDPTVRVYFPTKRKLSSDSTPLPSAKTAKITASSSPGAASSEVPQHTVITPRIEALVAPTSAS